MAMVSCPWGQDTLAKVSCPRGQNNPEGDKIPHGILSPGTRYRRGQDKLLHRVKKSNLSFFFSGIFLISCILMFFYHSFHRWYVFFPLFVFQSCDFIVVITDVMHFRDCSCRPLQYNLVISICYGILIIFILVLGILRLWCVRNWLVHEQIRLYCSRYETNFVREKMSAQVFLKTFLQGYGCTAGGRPHFGGCSTNGHIIHSMSTRHKSPVTRHHSPSTSHRSSRHRSLTGKHTRHQAPGTGQPGTSHQSLDCWLVQRSSVTSHQSLVTKHRVPGSEH